MHRAGKPQLPKPRPGQAPKRKPEIFGTALKSFFRVSGLDRRLANLDLEVAWSEIAQELKVEKSRIESIRKGRLTIAVETTIQKYELENFHRNAIIKRFAERLTREKIVTIRFKIGTFAKDIDGEKHDRRQEKQERPGKREGEPHEQ